MGWCTLPTLSKAVVGLRPHLTTGDAASAEKTELSTTHHAATRIKTPTIPIPFYKLLKIVAIARPDNVPTRTSSTESAPRILTWRRPPSSRGRYRECRGERELD